MNLSFANSFVDPITKEKLFLNDAVFSTENEIETGYLVSSTNKYPIVRGIPRFVEFEKSNYAQSFGYQWNKWSKVQFESENVNKPMEGHTTNMWEKITQFDSNNSNLTNKLLLDIGCGPGRFVDVAASKGARVIGVDYSSAVEAARENFKSNPNICIVQADALNLPFENNLFDGSFTIGVLHHTPSPYKGVEEAYRVVKKGGWFGISVYGKSGYYDFPSVQLWRKFFNLLKPIFANYPPLIYTYFVVYVFGPIRNTFPPLGRFLKLFFPFISIPDKRWSILDTFDSVSPSYQSAHESYEVYSWLKKSGFENISPSDWGFSSYAGTK